MYSFDGRFLYSLFRRNTDAVCFNDKHEFFAYRTSIYSRLFFCTDSGVEMSNSLTFAAEVNGPSCRFRNSISLVNDFYMTVVKILLDVTFLFHCFHFLVPFNSHKQMSSAALRKFAKSDNFPDLSSKSNDLFRTCFFEAASRFLLPLIPNSWFILPTDLSSPRL